MNVKSFAETSQNKIIQKLGNSDVDLAILQSLMSNGFSKIEKAKEKSVVLVIGNTGSGKSTTINYLMGCTMKEIEKGGDFVIVTEDDNKYYATIGHTNQSETLYPETYVNKEDEVAYCDCPGFEDNRGLEERICISINTQLAVKFAKIIKAIVVVIDYHELKAVRAEGFNKLSNTLGQLLKDPAAIIDSIFFIITKVSTRITENNINQMISKMAEEGKMKRESFTAFFKGFTGQISEEKKKKEIENFEKKMKILELMQKNLQNIMLINVLDKGESKNKIVSHIKDSRGMTPDAFDFREYDDARVLFDQLIFKITHEGAKIIQSRVDLPNHIQLCEYEIKDSEERICFYQEQINRLQLDDQLTEKQEIQIKQIKILQSKYESNEDLMKNNNMVKRNQLKKEVNELEEELKELDSAELILYWEELISEKISFLWRFRKMYFGVKGFFEYSGVPFEKVETYKVSGKFEIIKTIPEKGIYTASYNSASGIFNYMKDSKDYIEDKEDKENKEDKRK